jgi:hypothetical protein
VLELSDPAIDDDQQFPGVDPHGEHRAWSTAGVGIPGSVHGIPELVVPTGLPTVRPPALFHECKRRVLQGDQGRRQVRVGCAGRLGHVSERNPDTD